MLRVSIQLVWLAVLFAAQAHAASIDQLRSFLTKTTSARGEFVQRVVRDAATQQSSGRFVFQRPGKFRWIYEKPYEHLIIADGQRLTMFDKDLNQATIRKLASALPSSPASILFGSNDFEREFAGDRALARARGGRPRSALNVGP